MVAAYNPNAPSSGTATGKAAPGSSGNTSSKTTDLQVLTGTHTMKKGQQGPPAPAYHSLGFLLEKPFHDAALVNDIQRKLVSAGFLEADSFVTGIYDNETIAAYKEALTSASFYGKQFDTIIQERVKAGAKPKGGSAARAPFSPQVSNPAEIRAALDQALPNILGHSLTDAELNNLTSLYQSLQVGAQRQSYDTNLSGGTSTAVVPIDVFAQQQAEKLHPGDVHVKQLANVAKMFTAVVGQSAPETATF